VKHFGLAQMQGEGEEARRQLMKINDWDSNKTSAHIKQSWKTWQRRSAIQWKLNLDVLRDYGIEPEFHYTSAVWATI
jgi:hypothetical protein